VDGLAELDQAIRIVISTPKRSLPGAPDFGSRVLDYVDLPRDAAETLIIGEVGEALRLNEKRIEVKSVRLQGRTVAIAWTPVNMGDVRLTTINL
jgi:phage baseplate assembly protein W